MERNYKMIWIWYDYGARFYEPAAPHFTTMDPLAEDYNFQSPYLYASNNPVRYIDYMGMNSEDQDEKKSDEEKLIEYYQNLGYGVNDLNDVKDVISGSGDNDGQIDLSPWFEGVGFVQAEGRLALPFRGKKGIGATGSVQFGVMLDTKGNLATYFSPSIGVSGGVGGFAGISAGYIFAENLFKLKGSGLTAGVVTGSGIPGVPAFSGEFNVALNNLKENNGAGFTIGGLGYGMGAAGYGEYTHTFISNPVNISNMSFEDIAKYVNRSCPYTIANWKAEDAMKFFNLLISK